MFPINWCIEDKDKFGFPDQIPLAFVLKYQKQIEINHGQTVERLAERGGLSPLELMGAIIKFRGNWHALNNGMKTEHVVQFLQRELKLRVEVEQLKSDNRTAAILLRNEKQKTEDYRIACAVSDIVSFYGEEEAEAKIKHYLKLVKEERKITSDLTNKSEKSEDE